MRKEYVMKKWAGVLTIFVLLTTVGSVSAAISQGLAVQEHSSVIQLQKKVPPVQYTYDIIWDDEYPIGVSEDAAQTPLGACALHLYRALPRSATRIQ